MEAMGIYYNYVRKHQALDGNTPAEASGIKIEFEANGIENLMSLASKKLSSDNLNVRL